MSDRPRLYPNRRLYSADPMPCVPKWVLVNWRNVRPQMRQRIVFSWIACRGSRQRAALHVRDESASPGHSRAERVRAEEAFLSSAFPSQSAMKAS